MRHFRRTFPVRLTMLALVLLLLPLLALVRPQPVAAAGVVSQCTETALRSALEGGGLITFSCSGTIPIAGELVIEADTVIDGGGVVTLDGGGTTRLLVVNSGVELELLGLTLSGGFSEGFDRGGAILNHGTVTLTASTLSGNRAGLGGAIYNFGALTMIDSDLTDNGASFGGAIYNNEGDITVIASTLTHNSASLNAGAIFDAGGGGDTTIIASILQHNSSSRGSGALENAGDMTIVASTLSGNSASTGGAIRNFRNLTIVASTLSGNSAESNGGAILNAGTLTVTASTLTGNSAPVGGAIRNFDFGDFIAIATITASTLAGNSAEQGEALYGDGDAMTLTANILSGSNLCAGPEVIASNGYNVASDDTCNLTSTGDLQDTNPLLDDLRDNGGPTLTLLPENDSPALNHVPNALCATLSATNDGRDQRGAPRPDGDATCDSGAAEAGTLVYAWLLAAYASPDTLFEGQSATLTAIASGPVGGELQYSFACPGNLVGPQDSPQSTCFFPEPGVFEIEITVSESGPPANADSSSVTVTVNAVQVAASLTPPDDTFAEGGSYQGTGSFTTDGPGPWTATVDYDDDAGPQDLGPVTPGPAIPISAQYLLAGDYTITLEICDTTVNRCGTAAASVTVTAAQVVVTLAPPVDSVGEGDSYEGSGSFTTDGPGPWAASVDYGDGSPPQALDNVTPMTPIPISHAYLLAGNYTLTLEVCDTTVNRCGTATASVTVTAVAPSVTIIPVSLKLGQGDTFQASGSFTDPGLGPWTATVDYGQGAGPQPLSLDQGNRTFSLSRQYLQQGSFTVTVVVCDAANACGSASVSVEVGNVPPVIADVRVSFSGAKVTLTVEAGDPGGGPLTYRFSCAGMVIGPQVSPAATCDFTNQTGQFAVLVEVIDANQVTTSQTVLVELPTSLCVGERSGTARYMGNPGGCVRGEQPLTLTSTGSWSFCVGERSGSLRYLFNAAINCLRGEWKLTLPEQGPITVCVGERSRSMRYVANANQCNPRGELVYRIANKVS